MKKTFNYIIAYLSSLTFTIILLTALTATVSINIMEDEISAIIIRYQLWQGAAIKYLFNWFGFSDLYNSLWFTSLLILFCINLLLCTIKRIPRTLKNLIPLNPETSQLIPSSPSLKETYTLNSIHPDFTGHMRALLSEKISDPSIHFQDQSAVYFSQKGRYAHLGFYLAHGGLFILLMGGVVNTSSYKGNLYLREGETVDTLFIKNDDNHYVKKLDFALRLDRCEAVPSAKQWDNFPALYRSAISIVKDGTVIKTEVLEGYRTTTHKGVRIAQYGARKDADYRIVLSTTPKRSGARSRVMALRYHDFFKVPETGHTIRIKGFFSPFRSSLQASLLKRLSASSQNRTPPLSGHMVNLEVYGENNKLLYTPAVFSHQSRYQQPWDEDYDFSLLGIEEIEPREHLIRLKISFEPGGQLIWTGFAMAILGFSMMFSLSHRKLWVEVEERKGHYHITLAGWSSRNQEVLKDYFEDIKELARRQHETTGLVR